MMERESQFSALTPEKKSKPEKKGHTEQAIKESLAEIFGKEPIQETPDSISYLGVRLSKAQNRNDEFVPQRDKYQDYINDKFSLELQKKIAVSFLQGDPILVEGGTSIGKTTTVRKMSSELGWEIHYCNLNGATDVEDLMGRYIPNPHKAKPEDPEYIFADGKVTSGLRQEEGKTKVIILDELNAAAPNILIRMHEVLDALERSENVVLSEDASETVAVNKHRTKIIALMNPPGKGYFAREPLDPAQLRRWVYQKETTDLSPETFSHSTDALFNLVPKTEEPSRESFLVSPQEALSRERLAEIPGMKEITAKYKEFHAAAKEMLKTRKLAADQPQTFTYDDRMEPRRVRDFVLRFYNGDVNETFQNALRYYYSNKIELETDKQKLEELIQHVAYIPAAETKRKTLEEKINPESALKDKAEKELADLMASEKIPDAVKDALRGKETMLSPDILEQIKEAKTILGQDFLGPEEVKSIFDLEAETPSIPFSREELERAKELGQMLILRQPITMEQMNDVLSGKVKDDKKLLYSVDESTGKPKSDCWYKDEKFWKEEKPEAKWALVSKEIIPDSTSKNYLQQTDTLVEYLQNQVFKDKLMPKQYQEAIDEYTKAKANITEIMKSDWKKAAEMLEALNLTELCRQSPVEALYDITAYFQTTGERLLPNRYTWTKRRGSGGRLVGVGGFDSGGVGVDSPTPDDSNDFLGVSFSRSL